MLDLLAATAVVAALLAVLALAGLAVTVVPFVRAGDVAERRGLSVVRAGLLQALATAAALLAALLLHRSDAPLPVVLLPLLLTWAVPLALRLLPAGSVEGLVGRAGRHE